MVSLLQVGDPPAVETVCADRPSPLLLVCEHAGNGVPRSLHQLGLSADILQTHIAWDVGIAKVARGVAQALGASLILQQYSRLVIDCNRPPHGPVAIPETSDGIVIHGNKTLSQAQRQARIEQIFNPYDRALQRAFAGDTITCAVSVHSYTRQLAGQPSRPWDVGLLARQDLTLSHHLQRHYGQQDATLRVALNQPYQIDDDTDWFIVEYAEKHAIPHCLIEICNDQLHHGDGIAHHVALLAGGLRSFMNTLNQET